MPKLTRTRTGLWTARKEIPQDVRGVIGKREDKPTWPGSLSHAEAKVEYGVWLTNLEQRIAAARAHVSAPPVHLSHRRLMELVGHWYRSNVAHYEEDPGDALGWEEWLEPVIDAARDGARAAKLERAANALLVAEGLAVTEQAKAALEARLLEAYVALAGLMQRRAAGDYGPDVYAGSLPEASQKPAKPATPVAAGTSVSIKGLFASYVAERQPAASTVKAWKRMIERLVEFLEHDDARKVAATDLVRWKDHLLTQGKSAKTVGETYLAAARATFAFAVDNHRIPTNPVAGLRVRSPKKLKLRDPGFLDIEAALILTAAYQTPPTSAQGLARRWGPWLCAYTGARVGEIMQLRKEDVYQEGGIWLLRITPEAGSVKTGEARLVPLHTHLIEQGFVAMVGERGPGPIFYDPAKRRNGGEGNPQYKKAGERLAHWVRELGVDDAAVQPNHGWRHRFKTVARSVGMDPEARDVLQGHAPRGEGENYGRWQIAALKREIDKLPRYATPM